MDTADKLAAITTILLFSGGALFLSEEVFMTIFIALICLVFGLGSMVMAWELLKKVFS